MIILPHTLIVIIYIENDRKTSINHEAPFIMLHNMYSVVGPSAARAREHCYCRRVSQQQFATADRRKKKILMMDFMAFYYIYSLASGIHH